MSISLKDLLLIEFLSMGRIIPNKLSRERSRNNVKFIMLDSRIKEMNAILSLFTEEVLMFQFYLFLDLVAVEVL